MFGSLALLPAQKIINHLLQGDSYLQDSLQTFDGKTIEVCCQSPKLTIVCSFDAGHIRLSALDSDTLGLTPDATISGKATELFALLGKPASQRPLANPAIEISGDAVLVQDLYNCIQRLDIQWQDYLAPFIGDIATHNLEQLGQSASQFSTQAQRSMGRNIEEYLKEEKRLFPARSEVAAFSDRLDQLKLKLDRLQARTQELRSRLQEPVND